MVHVIVWIPLSHQIMLKEALQASDHESNQDTQKNRKTGDVWNARFLKKLNINKV